MPVEFSLRSSLDPNHPEARGAGASAMILDDGRFVAEQQGIYTVVAMSGSAMARASVRIERRDVTREFEFLGQARISDHLTSDFWIDWEEEFLYTAYYQGGPRVLDVSGELVGDLYSQGREVGSFFSADAEGHIPNAAMAWGPQPHKGTIFFTDSQRSMGGPAKGKRRRR